MLNTSSPRHQEEVFSFGSASSLKEVDYLLALVKEDYAERSSLSRSSQAILRNNLQKIMAPLGDQYDYLFFISRQRDLSFISIILYKSEFSCIKNGQQVQCGAGERGVAFIPMQPAHRYYLCNAQEGKEVKPQDIQQFMFAVADTFQATSPLLLIETNREAETVNPETIQAKATLVAWPATYLDPALLDVLACQPFTDAPAGTLANPGSAPSGTASSTPFTTPSSAPSGTVPPTPSGTSPASPSSVPAQESTSSSSAGSAPASSPPAAGSTFSTTAPVP